MKVGKICRFYSNFCDFRKKRCLHKSGEIPYWWGKRENSYRYLIRSFILVSQGECLGGVIVSSLSNMKTTCWVIEKFPCQILEKLPGTCFVGGTGAPFVSYQGLLVCATWFNTDVCREATTKKREIGKLSLFFVQLYQVPTRILFNGCRWRCGSQQTVAGKFSVIWRGNLSITQHTYSACLTIAPTCFPC